MGETVLFNDHWFFKFGKAEPMCLERNKTGVAGGASALTVKEGNQPAFPQLLKALSGENAGKEIYHLIEDLEPGWKEVTLPHDWTAGQPYSHEEDGSAGYHKRGEGWYRKKFRIPEEWKRQRVHLELDGVMHSTRIWLNGCYLGNHFSGYTGFELDLTEYLWYDGQENVLLIRADNTTAEGWWEEGGGIYRNVWLKTYSSCHFQRHGVFVYTPDLSPESAVIAVEGTIENETSEEKKLCVRHEIRDESGVSIAQGSECLRCGPLEKVCCKLTLTAENPNLWEEKRPYRYTLVSCLLDADGNTLDSRETKFGIRTLIYKADGLHWNGRLVELKGVCEHQDFAVVGAALSRDILRYKLCVLREMGANAIRCAHHAASPELLELCDELGILVLNENRHFEVTREGIDDLRELIIGARNHPCVFMWCLENEEFITAGKIGENILSRLMQYARKYDPTRQITIAGQFSKENLAYMKLPDVTGFNYDYDDAQKLLNQFPRQLVMATESVSFASTRGEYEDSPEKGYCTSYDSGSYYLKLMKMADENVDFGTLGGALGTMDEGGKLLFSWRHYRYQLPKLGGVFLWTGFDYRGEPFPWYWPSKSSQYGACDRCGFPKDAFYYWKSVWTEEPMIHMLPHWNWQGKEGQKVLIEIYSNCDAVEVFVNGEALGKKSHQRGDITKFEAVYRPGEIEAVGYGGHQDVPQARHRISTAEEPFAVKLAERLRGKNQLLLEARVVDAKGRVCPWAENLLRIEATGGKLCGADNGDPSAEPQEKADRISAFHGKALFILQKTNSELEVKITSEGLISGDFQLK